MSLNASYTFRLQNTNFILANDSGLEKEEKIKNKMLFLTFIFISLLAKLDKEEPLNK